MRERNMLLQVAAAGFFTTFLIISLNSHGMVAENKELRASVAQIRYQNSPAAENEHLRAELAKVREDLTHCRARARSLTPRPSAPEDLCVPQLADATARAETRRKQGETASCLAAGGGCGGCCPACTPYVDYIPNGSEGNDTDTCFEGGYCTKTDGHTHVELRGTKCVCYALDAELSYVKFFLTDHADCLYARGNHIEVKARGGDDVIVLEDPHAFSQPDPDASESKKYYHMDP